MVCWKKTSAVTGAILSICLASTGYTASAGTPDPAAKPSPDRHGADVILTGGHILTEDSHDSVVEALAIRNGRLIALGTNAQILPLADSATRVIDLHGRTATPGLIDAHIHLAEGGMNHLRSLDLSTVASIAEIRRLIAARAAQLHPGEWLLGAGWDEAKLAEKRYIAVSDLDDIAPRNPVWLEHTTGHYGAANSAALRLAGIDRTTPDPTAGTIQRDSAGAPAGVLKESAQNLVQRLVPEPSLEQWRKAILDNVQLMHQQGMTGVKDPDLTQLQWDAYESLAREGKLQAHVCALWHFDQTLEGARALVTRAAKLPRPPAAIAPNLVLCGVKVYMDGSGGARTAWMYDDWHKNSTEVDTGNKGYPLLDPAVYKQIVRLFHDAGIHIGTHAIGDRAVDWVVDTYAEVLAANPKPGLRHSIIHANTPTDHAITVMADLQHRYDAGYPETQGEFMYWIGDNYAGNLGPQRALRLDPYRTYLRKGILFAGGSDYPVTPLPARLGLWASVARQTLHGSYGAQPFGTAEAISAGDALKSYTAWAAHQLFLEADAGSLEPGKSADIAVWDQDPLTAPTAALENLQCELTLFRGTVVYQAAATPITITNAKHHATK
jgi:predicted amidohydrolase YtcJ